MAKRLSDTAAIAARAPHRQQSDEAESHSICVRPISNGYVVQHSSSKGNRYECSETYSKDRPVIALDDPTGPADGGGNSLRDAVSIAKGRL